MTDGKDIQKNEIIERTPSPCDLNLNDNPDNVITQVQLKCDNYEKCARTIPTSLRAR